MLAPSVGVTALPATPVAVPISHSARSLTKVKVDACRSGVHRVLTAALCLPALKLVSGVRRRVACQSRIFRKAEKTETEVEAEAEASEAEEEPDEVDAGDEEESEAQSREIQKAKPRPRRKPFDPTLEPGAMAPLGFFDPLGFCPSGDEGKFKQLRAAELKHGRVAMLASVGLVAQCYIRLPFLGLKESPAGYKAALLVPSLWMFGLVVIGSMLMEWLVWKEDPWKEPGNFGDPLGLNMYNRDMRDKELCVAMCCTKKESKKSAAFRFLGQELNNGRFAMFATSGILAAELLTGKDPRASVIPIGFRGAVSWWRVTGMPCRCLSCCRQ